MSKMIAIFDKPQICYDCPCYKDNYSRRCALNNRKIKDEIDKHPYMDIQDWCPLKEVPEKQIRDYPEYNSYLTGYNDGWDDCISKISGG